MKVLAKNKRANYDYTVTDKLVAGIVLSGAEVKSIKAGHISLKGSYITIKDSEAYLTGAHVTPYNQASMQGEPARSRKLLLHRKQINELLGDKTSGLVAVPLAVLQDKSLIKIEIGVGRGKKRYDKREVIKKRDQERDARRGSDSLRH